MAKEKYNWEEIFKKLDEGSRVTDIAKEYGAAIATVSRKYTAYKAGELFARTDVMGDDAIERLAAKELNILVQQKKNILIRKKANDVSRNLAIGDTIIEALKDADFKPYKPIIHKDKEFSKEKNPQVFIVSDLHYVDKNRSKSLNKMGEMWMDNWNNSENVEIVFNGDLIENTHHISQLLDEKSSNPSIQAVEVANIIAEQVAYFKSNSNANITLKWIVGNHDEIRQITKALETPNTNWVVVIKGIVDALLKEYGIKSSDSSRFEVIKNDDKGMHIQHGHLLKSNRQENVEQFLIKKSILEGKLYGMYVISHFHQFRHWIMKGSKDNNHVVLTPSMKDWNGEFEDNMNMSNTSGMVSIEGNRNVKYIPIPK